MPPVYFFIFFLLAPILHYLIPVAEVIPPMPWLGAVLIALGIFLNLWADSLFKKIGTTVRPDERPAALLVSGPFRISRHPMYLGMVGILLGAAVLLRSLTPLISPLLFFLTMEQKFIPLEEAKMEKQFGKEYGEYKTRVRRWI
jgi:protein-S-isoprenylcysteine O-methyltransferase Ste14